MENIPFRLHAPWQEVKEQVKEVYPELTDEDLNYVPAPGSRVLLLKKNY